MTHKRGCPYRGADLASHVEFCSHCGKRNPSFVQFHQRHTQCQQCHKPLQEGKNTVLEIVTGICNECRNTVRNARLERLGLSSL